ncbi:MAG: cell division protein ZapA [Frisingicoccus sp.]|uniref:cell division protein ZapA n=2 Tax=Frisingicoccus sp. TaxID=1918627 RepID=UPI0025BD249A|nr:cell division protein ZapA [Frisingicoccus sp.]MDD6231810.1 cell division protein ZapA [Frisingicoccus sp.]MDY4833987.1 cell division protein ZapA [Frisingicoccus sp.]MDY5957039.1 cell division protein ZapA [Frisingicoccus sp.]
MAAKKDIQVVIGGKVYTLSGYESEEYLQKIALYINNKMDEMDQISNYRRLSVDMQKTLLELNMADDYYKAKRQIELLETDIEEKDKIEYDLKHELISSQIHLEEAEQTIEELKNEINELQKQIVKLEAKSYQEQ